MCARDGMMRRFGRVCGYAYFKDIARGRLSGGDAAGFLKLVSRADEPTRHVVIGVQIIGGSVDRSSNIQHEGNNHSNNDDPVPMESNRNRTKEKNRTKRAGDSEESFGWAFSLVSLLSCRLRSKH